ncbi:hypothetical protein BS78_07G067000 [Paspalum vaginatum]|nr:hypothetical protein BS78_07G067000 [Paspalum vaginatum]
MGSVTYRDSKTINQPIRRQVAEVGASVARPRVLAQLGAQESTRHRTRSRARLAVTGLANLRMLPFYSSLVSTGVGVSLPTGSHGFRDAGGITRSSGGQPSSPRGG